jgi:hypothetical protein
LNRKVNGVEKISASNNAMLLERGSEDFQAITHSEIDLAIATILCHQSKGND